MCLDNCLHGICFFGQETLATAMQKIMCVLGSFTSDTEVKVCFAILLVTENLIKNTCSMLCHAIAYCKCSLIFFVQFLLYS